MSSSYHNMALDGIVAGINVLTLTGLTGGTPLASTQVYKKKLMSKTNATLPAIFVTLVPAPETIISEETLTGTDTIGYPCGVTLVVANNQSLDVDDVELYWRQQIAGKFHWQRPTELASAINGTGRSFEYSLWEPGNVIDLAQFFDANLFVSTMLIRVAVRKTRP